MHLYFFWYFFLTIFRGFALATPSQGLFETNRFQTNCEHTTNETRTALQRRDKITTVKRSSTSLAYPNVREKHKSTMIKALVVTLNANDMT